MGELPQRRKDVDVARGLAIFLIVVHHVSQYFGRYVPESFHAGFGNNLAEALGYVNVPTFILMAGIVLAIGNKPLGTVGDYLRFERRKLCRLMLPFLAVSLLSLLVKTVYAGRASSTGWSALVNTVIAPRGGAAGHLWFLYCLMGIFLVWPLLIRLGPGRRFPLLWAVLVLVAVLPIPGLRDDEGRPYFELSDVLWHLPLFAAGYWYGKLPLEKQRPRLAGILAGSGLLAGSLVVRFWVSWPAGYAWEALGNAIKWLGYAGGCFALLWICGLITMRARRLRDVLEKMGLYSYDIYLLHVLFVGHPLALLTSKLAAGPVLAYCMYAAAILAAVIVPMGMARVIRSIPKLAFVVLGVPLAHPARPAAS